MCGYQTGGNSSVASDAVCACNRFFIAPALARAVFLQVATSPRATVPSAMSTEHKELDIEAPLPDKHLKDVHLMEKDAPGAKWKNDEVHTLPPKWVVFFVYACGALSFSCSAVAGSNLKIVFPA